MNWPGVLLYVTGLTALNVVLQPPVRRFVLRRRLRAGTATVSIRPQDGSGSWQLHRIELRDGDLVLQRAGDHSSVAGVVVHSLAGTGRSLRFRERLWVVTGARRALIASTEAGPVELAATDDVLAWLSERLIAA
jgi:hypothetical protein